MTSAKEPSKRHKTLLIVSNNKVTFHSFKIICRKYENTSLPCVVLGQLIVREVNSHLVLMINNIKV